MVRFRPLPWLTLFAVAALTVLISLGVWQLGRREWKLTLIDRIEQSMKAEPIELAAALAEGMEQAEFRAVRVTGTFAHDKELYLMSHRAETAGYEVITPLELPDGAPVLIDRGFVPAPLVDPTTRAEGQLGGIVTITGWLRKSGERFWYTPEDDPSANRWYARDAERMAAAKGLKLVAPIFVVADETPNPGGWPKGGMELNLRNQHLIYALTWFGLAAVLLGVYVAFHVARGRLAVNLPR